MLPEWALRPWRWLRRIRVIPPEQELFWPEVTFFSDGLATIHNSDFQRDPRFTEAYGRGLQTGSWRGTRNLWRAHVLCWAADCAARLPGDFVECGVFRGGSAAAVIAFVGMEALGKRFYLVDTFSGAASDLWTPEERLGAAARDVYSPSLEFVREQFKTSPFVELVPGRVPDVLPSVGAERVGFLHLDMNAAVPEVAAAAFFWDKLVPGAPILLDDYAYRGYGPQKAAFDEFARARGVSILTLPTGQGLLVKP
jgi:hypothetical protein